MTEGAPSSSPTSAWRWSPPARAHSPTAAAAGATAETSRQVRFGGAWIETPVIRGEPAAGLELTGPAVFELPEATFVVPPTWSARVDAAGSIVAGADA